MNRHVLVTGARGGIGVAIVERLLSDGSTVTGIDSTTAATSESVAGYHEFAVDVRDPDAVAVATAKARDRVGPFTAVVTAAGIQRINPVSAVSPAEWAEVLAVNLSGTFFAIQAVQADLANATDAAVVTIGSEIGLAGLANYAAYSASKGGVIALTKTLAREFAPEGIRVNCVAPGPIEAGMLLGEAVYTDSWMTQNIPLGRWGRGEDVAATVSFLLSDGGSFFTGQILSPNGGVVI